ncbi:MAG: DUF4465 domain-containing protein [Bacteroidales bacterium]|jgi:hypothetical protein|nr:DUF4465 domain-containing protein [Bacteroidales bacterium]
MKSLCFYKLFLLFALFFWESCSDEDLFKTDVASLDEFQLSDETYWSGSDHAGNFTSGNKIFTNQYYPDWNTWSGFAYSNLTNYQFFDEKCMYSAYDKNVGVEGNIYAVGHQLGRILVTLKDSIHGEEPRSVQLSNSTYTALAILHGYGYAKKFGGRDGNDPDWFKVTIRGIGLENEITGTVDFFLADFRFNDNTNDYILDKWEYVDLTSLGIVKKLEFVLSSSDAGTPLFFCLDNLKGRIPLD